MSPPVPRTGRRSNKDNENDLAKLHAQIALQRLTNAVLTLPCKICGCSSARVFAMALRKSAVSWDHRPPSSTAKTTQRAPPSPENSGHVVSFTLRAACKATPLVVAAYRRAVPSPCKGDTTVVSTATCAPCQRDNPTTMTSTRRHSSGLEAPTSKSRIEPVQTLPYACLPSHLQLETSATQHTSPRTCTMVAIHGEWEKELAQPHVGR